MSLYLDRVRTSDNFRIAFALGPYRHSTTEDARGRADRRARHAALHLSSERPLGGVLIAVLMSAITGLAFNYASRRR